MKNRSLFLCKWNWLIQPFYYLNLNILLHFLIIYCNSLTIHILLYSTAFYTSFTITCFYFYYHINTTLSFHITYLYKFIHYFILLFHYHILLTFPFFIPVLPHYQMEGLHFPLHFVSMQPLRFHLHRTTKEYILEVEIHPALQWHLLAQMLC